MQEPLERVVLAFSISSQMASKLCYSFLMEGGCHCGAIRFKTNTEPYWGGACYCSDCRKISGAPYLVFAAFNEGEVEVLQGTPKKYSSSEKVIRSFCETCASPFAYTYKESQDKLFIPIGVFDNPSGFTLKEHIFVGQKLPWVRITDDLPQQN